MLSSCTPSEVVRTLRYVFFGCFCYQSSCLLIYLGTGVFIQMLGHENNSKHVVLPRSTPYLDLVHGPPSAQTDTALPTEHAPCNLRSPPACLCTDRIVLK